MYSFYINQPYIVPIDVGSYLLEYYKGKFELLEDPLEPKLNTNDPKQSGKPIKIIGDTDKNLQWTIGICNYKSSIYFKYQLKSLYEFNDTPFNLIIVDNSIPSDEKILKNLTKNYKNVQIIVNELQTVGAGRQHAEALNIIHQYTKTKYLMVMDPDFFWIRKNILKILQRKLDEGYVSVGSPFWSKFIDDTSPAAWGCAYLTSILRKGDFDHLDSSLSQKEISYLLTLGKDTAWKLRDRFKKENLKTFSFEDRFGLPDWFPIKGQHSANFFDSVADEKLSHEYYYCGHPIAYHLCRGSYETDADFPTTEQQKDIKPPKEWVDLREKYSQFFYEMLKKDDKKQMKIHLHFPTKNDARILPYFFKHYDRYVEKYFAYYNVNSKDDTLQILKSHPNVTIIEDSNQKLDERFLISIKNEQWKKYSNHNNCDWVILVDNDEFLYHPNFIELLEQYDKEGINFPKVKGYQMFSESFPTENKQITELIKKGILYHPYDKQVILKPDITPNYSFGCHYASPQGPIIKTSNDFDIKMLHYKIFGNEYPEKRLAVNETLSDFNKASGCGVYNRDPNSEWNPYNELKKIRIEAKDVI